MRAPRNLPRTVRNARRNDGMTLIEVLVTLVIISVGLLGVAALQLTTVRNNYDAFVRSQAAMLASDMLDRMRANRSNASDYIVDIEEEDLPPGTPGTDIGLWRSSLVAQLPNGVGGIEYDVNTRIVSITIQWSERAEVTDDRTLTFRTSSQI